MWKVVPSIWDDAQRVDDLKKLWAEGLSASMIGVRLSTPEITITKNSVIAKARRLKLKQRGSPIKRKNSPVPRPKKAQGAARSNLGVSRPGCLWPIGHPSEKGYHSCGEPTSDGHSYCDEHEARAYRRGATS